MSGARAVSRFRLNLVRCDSAELCSRLLDIGMGVGKRVLLYNSAYCCCWWGDERCKLYLLDKSGKLWFCKFECLIN